MALSRRLLVQSGLGAASLALTSNIVRADDPIRIGFLTVKTGPLAAGGIQMEQGMNLFLKLRGNKLAGRDVQLIVADTAGSPATTRTKAQELVERDKVHVLIGPLAAFEALAISDYINAQKMPTLGVAAADDTTQRNASPWYARATASAGQCAHVIAHYAATELKYKRMAIIGDDFAYGHEQNAAFLRVFEDNGGKIPLIGGMTAMDEAILQQTGEDAVGIISANWYSAAYESPANREFVAGMQRDYKIDPGYYAAGPAVAGAVLEAGLKALGGKFDDREALMKAMRTSVITDSVRGPVKFDDRGNAIGNIYIRRVEKKGGKYVNSVIKTYPDVSQFWTYPEAEFLAKPVYSRDYPPAKNLEN
jgi:branched-chain amino acid transport system substrate-binding protein